MPPLVLHSLALFPLDTVLFPGGVLPLRVFEVRYLDMVGKCHRTGAPFGVVALTEGQEVRTAGAPPEHLASIGTLARISILQQLQPGLIALTCTGEQRFHIDRQEQLKHGLWIADVTLLDADTVVPIPEDLRHTAQALQHVYDSLNRRSQRADVPAANTRQLDDCGWVANRWCELLPLPPSLKQRLMSLDNPLMRLELVADVLDRTGIDAGQSGSPASGT